MWSLRNTYLYLVCLISIIIIIIGLITFANSIVELVIQDNYYPSMTEKMSQYNKDTPMAKADYEAQAAKEIAQQQVMDKNRRIKNSIESLSMFFVALPFYLYHWRKIQKEQPNIKKQETLA